MLPVFENGVVVLRFDDNCDSHYDIYQIMKEYDYRGVEAVVATWVEDNGGIGLSIEQLKEMQDYGWDICNHGYEHKTQNSHSYEEIEEDIIKNRDWLEKNGFNGSNFYVTPGNYLAYKNLTEKYCDLILTYSDKYEAYPFIDNVIGCYVIISNTTVTDIKTVIDEAYYRGKCVVLLNHGIDGDGWEPMTSENFIEVLDYIKLLEIPVKTFSELL
jgi:peptidoglycan/xylan/chitin deacetylase (PgdA/CDA1 family)